MSNNLKVHFSSATDEWSTPTDLFTELSTKYGPFQLDVCADPSNAKCQSYFSKEQDGLKQSWEVLPGFACWMNPPYGREICKWVRKAYDESQKGSLVVCLLPARTDTKWFHDYCTKGQITFIKGRLKFGNAKNSAPFPSMIVVFGKPQ